jgi:hypothetical protein
MRTEKFADYHEGYRKLLFDSDLPGILGQLSGDVSIIPSSAGRSIECH